MCWVDKGVAFQSKGCDRKRACCALGMGKKPSFDKILESKKKETDRAFERPEMEDPCQRRIHGALDL